MEYKAISKKQQKVSWSTSNPSSPRKQNDLDFVLNSAPDFKLQKRETMKLSHIKPKSSSPSSDNKKPNKPGAKISTDDHIDSEFTDPIRQKVINRKSSIFKRSSTLNLIGNGLDSSENLGDEDLISDAEENIKFTVESDISGLTSVSEPSTRVPTTHPVKLNDDANVEDPNVHSDDEVVINDCRNIKINIEETDLIEEDKAENNNVEVNIVEDHSKEKVLPIGQDEAELEIEKNVSNKSEPEKCSEQESSPKNNETNDGILPEPISETKSTNESSEDKTSDELEIENYLGNKHEPEKCSEQATSPQNHESKDGILQEHSFETNLFNESNEDKTSDCSKQNEDNNVNSPLSEELYDNQEDHHSTRDVSDEESNDLNNNENLDINENNEEKELILEDDLHVSDAESEIDEGRKTIINSKVVSETTTIDITKDQVDQDSDDDVMKYFGNKIDFTDNVNNEDTHNDVLTILEHSHGLGENTLLSSSTFEGTIDQIVADVSTKAVIRNQDNEMRASAPDFASFNWKPNVDFFQFGGGNTKKRKTENVFNFGRGIPPPPQNPRKRLSAKERPRSKSLQRLERYKAKTPKNN